MASATRRIVQAETMRSQIAEDLRLRLQGSEYSPDDRLIDTDVARQYGTSRMPAREALLALASQGFLRQTSRGFVLPVLSEQDIREAFEVRRLLEPEAAALAAGSLQPEGLARLEQAKEHAEAAFGSHATEAFMLANMQFRAAWIGALPNKRLRATIEGFSDQAQAVRIATLRDVDIRAVVLSGLATLHQAFQARDAEAARKRMLRFLVAAEDVYFRHVFAQAAS